MEYILLALLVTAFWFCYIVTLGVRIIRKKLDFEVGTMFKVWMNGCVIGCGNELPVECRIMRTRKNPFYIVCYEGVPIQISELTGEVKEGQTLLLGTREEMYPGRVCLISSQGHHGLTLNTDIKWETFDLTRSKGSPSGTTVRT